VFNGFQSLLQLDWSRALTRERKRAVPDVRPHYRNGHHVRGHWRRGPGGALGLGGGAVALAVVAVVAALSMASWLSPPPARPNPAKPTPTPATPKLQAPQTDRSHYIVQVASESRRDQAVAHATGLQARGFPNASVLRSDRYQPLRPGWWVTYVGPYAPTRAGKAQATATQRRLPDSLVRLIR
jgi:hypothetical protein